MQQILIQLSEEDALRVTRIIKQAALECRALTRDPIMAPYPEALIQLNKQADECSRIHSIISSYMPEAIRPTQF